MYIWVENLKNYDKFQLLYNFILIPEFVFVIDFLFNNQINFQHNSVKILNEKVLKFKRR